MQVSTKGSHGYKKELGWLFYLAQVFFNFGIGLSQRSFGVFLSWDLYHKLCHQTPITMQLLIPRSHFSLSLPRKQQTLFLFIREDPLLINNCLSLLANTAFQHCNYSVQCLVDTQLPGHWLRKEHVSSTFHVKVTFVGLGKADSLSMDLVCQDAGLTSHIFFQSGIKTRGMKK